MTPETKKELNALSKGLRNEEYHVDERRQLRIIYPSFEPKEYDMEHPKGESVTVPNEAMSLREVMEKQVTGVPLPIGREGVDGDEEGDMDFDSPDFEKIRQLDLFELEEFQAQIKEEEKELLALKKVADEQAEKLRLEKLADEEELRAELKTRKEEAKNKSKKKSEEAEPEK